MDKPESMILPAPLRCGLARRAGPCATSWQSRGTCPTATPPKRGVRGGGHFCPGKAEKCPFPTKLKSSLSAPGSDCARWLLHSSENIVGWGRDRPGNHSASGLAPQVVPVKPKWQHQPSLHTITQTDGPALKHYCSLPTLSSNRAAWRPIAGGYSY